MSVLPLLAVVGLACVATVVIASPPTDYDKAAQAIYPHDSVWRELKPNDYQVLSRNIDAYLGDRFYVEDANCLGGVVELADDVDRMFEQKHERAGSVESGDDFTWGTMRHGGTCQTGVIFSTDMQVRLVATFSVGTVGSSPSVLSVYAKGTPPATELAVLHRWAEEETRSFSGADPTIYPGNYVTKVFDLDCTAAGTKPRIESCKR